MADGRVKGKLHRSEQEPTRTPGEMIILPADWERHPELVQALQVLVTGAVRALAGR